MTGPPSENPAENAPEAPGAEAPAPEVVAQAPACAARPAPRFSKAGTLFWTLAFLTGAGLVLYSITNSRDQLLSEPERYLDRVVGRDLDAAQYTSYMPLWQRWLNSWDNASIPDALKDSIETYRLFMREGVLTNSETAPWTLAVLLAESGQVPDAERQLKPLGGNSSDLAFKRLFRTVYLDKSGVQLAPGYKEVLAELSPAWARDQVELRLADKRHDQRLGDEIQARMAARGRPLQARTTLLSAIDLVLIAGGLGAIGAWIWFRRKGVLAASSVAEGQNVSPWTIADGYGVLVRGATTGLIVAGCLSLVQEWWPTAANWANWLSYFSMPWLEGCWPVLTACATLLSGLPLFWLGRRHLMEPTNQSFASCFGLKVLPDKWPRLLGYALALMSLMILGETALGWITEQWQPPSLAESIPEEFLFDPWNQVIASALDAVIWAPIVEEIAFRGLLYSTLRRRLPMIWAAVVSSAIFGIVHGYSLQGFLTIFWSGFLWAIAFEKSRSLLPGMLCHALSNALAIGTPILIYRL